MVTVRLDQIVALCELLDAELNQRETTGDVSVLAAGGAFEPWLSFESRILLERHASALGVGKNWWTANEHKKVDLSVWDETDVLRVAIEFKLAHNNKNWRHEADGVWEDLFPTNKRKAALRPGQRASIVMVVGKVYDDPRNNDYPGQIYDLTAWEADFWSYLLQSTGEYAGKTRRAWIGHRFPIKDPNLSSSRTDHFVQLNLVWPMA